jgi:protein-disulfide isomerase
MPGRTLLTSKGVPWAAGSLLLLVAAVTLYLFTGAAASEPSRAQLPGAADIAYGPADAPLSVIEYSDFQCPFCAQYAPIMKTLREKYGEQVQFVFRIFPLANHPYATVSAKAAYAAFLQGKFWEMHDLLFEHQEEWSDSADPRSYFDSYAESLGLAIDQFHADMDAQTTMDFITRQADEGTRAGVTHTPWFVIGDSVVLPRTLEQFDSLIEERL